MGMVLRVKVYATENHAKITLNQKSILQTMTKGVILAFKFYSLGTTFC